MLKALAPRSGVKIAYPIDALAAQAQLSEARARHVLDILQQQRIVRARDAGGSVSYELQHDAFIEIVRPGGEQSFRCRNRLIGGLAGLLLLAGIGLNALLWQNERQEREDRRVAAGLTDRIDVDARKALEGALALAQGFTRSPRQQYPPAGHLQLFAESGPGSPQGRCQCGCV